MLREARISVRRLLADLGFTIFAVVCLALGIGTSTAIYSLAHTFVSRPLGLDGPEHVYPVLNGPTFVIPGMSWPDFDDLRGRQSVFAAIAASHPMKVPVVLGREAIEVPCEAVCDTYFALLKVRAFRGRLLSPDDNSGINHVAVISEPFWRNRLGGIPDIIGAHLLVAGEPYEVVGVTANGFQGFQPFLPTGVWIPLRAGMPAHDMAARQDRSVIALGRIRPGMSPRQANLAINAIGKALDTAYRLESGPRRWGVGRNASDVFSSVGTSTAGRALVALAIVITLVAALNVANLSLCRAIVRRSEWAIQAALGASRRQLARQQIIESGLLGLCSLGPAYMLFAILSRLVAIDVPVGAYMDVRVVPEMDLAVLASAFGFMCLAIFVSSLAPLLAATRRPLRPQLSVGGSATGRQWRLQHTVIAWQVCASIGLFVAAGVCINAVLAHVRDIRIEQRRIAIAQVDFAANGMRQDTVSSLTRAIMDRASTAGLVDAAAVTNGLPFAGMTKTAFAGQSANASGPRMASVVAGTREVFKTLGVALVKGRAFGESGDGAHVAVVSEGLADLFYETRPAVGQTLWMRDQPQDKPRPLTIVGIAADVEQPDSGHKQLLIWIPLILEREPNLLFIARSARPARALAALRTAIIEAEPRLRIGLAGTGETIVARRTYLLRKSAQWSMTLGVLATLMTIAGLYAVLSHAVECRRREIAIRLTLGATSRSIFALVVRQGLRAVASGTALALLITAVGSSVARVVLVPAIMPVFATSVVSASALLLLVGLVACYLPAHRAARVEPSSALREL